MKKTSLPLVLALLASTSAIVNCQKPPSKRVAPTNSPAGAVGDLSAGNNSDKVLGVQEKCSAQIIETRAQLVKEKDQIEKLKLQIKENNSEDDQKLLKEARIAFDKTCADAEVKMKEIKGDGCTPEVGKTNNDKPFIKTNVLNYCGQEAVALQEQGQPNARAAETLQKRLRQTEVAKLENLKKQTLVLTEAGKEAVLEKNTSWNQYLTANGEIKSSASELVQLVNSKKIVCTFDHALEHKENDTVLMKVSDYSDNETGKVPEGYKGKSVLVSLSRVAAADDVALTSLICINVSMDVLTAQQLQNVVQKVLKVQTAEQKEKADQTEKAEQKKVQDHGKKAVDSSVKEVKEKEAAKPAAKAAGKPVTVTEVKAIVASAEKSENKIKVKQIKSSGKNLDLILANNEKHTIASGQIEIEVGSLVYVVENKGKKYILTEDKKSSAEVIIEKATPAAPAAGAAEEAVVPAGKMTMTLSNVPKAEDEKAQKKEQKKSDSTVVVTREDLEKVKTKIVQFKIVSITSDAQTRSQTVTLNDGSVLQVTTKRVVNKEFIDAVVRLEFDSAQKPEKDATTGKLKYVGRLILSDDESVSVAFLK